MCPPVPPPVNKIVSFILLVIVHSMFFNSKSLRGFIQTAEFRIKSSPQTHRNIL